MLTRFLPFLNWLPEIGPRSLRADLIAGLTGAIVVLPQGVAFATIAGMPPEYGLYAGMIPAIVAALFGTSRFLVSGPTTAASIVLFSALSVHAEPGSVTYIQLALGLTFMVGVIELTLGFARMGAVVNFIAPAVIIGFTAGAAILIVSTQLKYFFGVELPPALLLHETLWQFSRQLPAINPFVLVVSLTTLLVGVGIRLWRPKFPYMVIAMITGSLLAALLNLIFGPATTGITLFGSMPRGLPPLSRPELSVSTIKELAPVAVAVSLFALTEAVAIGRSLAARAGQRIDASQEFIAQGLSNIAGSFFSGYVATGSFNRSAVNFQAGAKSPVAAILAGVLLMAILPLIGPLAAYLPHATMAGILVLVAVSLIDIPAIRQVLRVSGRESAILIVTFLSTLFLKLEFAILIGVLLSLIFFLMKVSHPKLVEQTLDTKRRKNPFSSIPDLPQCPQVKFLRIDGSIFFGSSDHVEETFDKLWSTHREQKFLAIIAAGMNFTDLAGCNTLAQETLRRRARGGDLYLINVRPGLLRSLNRGECLDVITPANVFQSKTHAIAHIYRHLDRSICDRCGTRIFHECGPKPPPSDD